MRLTKLADRLESYNFFSYIFLELPDAEFVDKILRTTFDQSFGDEAGVKYIENYIKSCAVKTPSLVLKELLIDRTQLLRAVSEKGCLPPYESLYMKRPPQDVIGELVQLYNRGNYCLADNVHESKEYIGVELNFMTMLCLKQLKALERNDLRMAKEMELLQAQFFNEHLRLWVPNFVGEMHKVSKTEFYKGIAIMLGDWVYKEIEFFCNSSSLAIK